MGNEAKRAYHHGGLKAALQSAAVALLDEGGVDTVTVREVARRAGVAHSAPANHFKDRKALLTDVAATITREVADVLRRTSSETVTQQEATDQRVWLKTAMTAMLSYALAHPHRYRLIHRHDILDMSNNGLAEAQQEVFDVLAVALEPQEHARWGRETSVFAAWSLVHGYVSLRLDGTLTAGADEITGAPRELALIDVLIDGLK